MKDASSVSERPYAADEIDLVEFFSTLWDGKWKILGAAIIAVTAVLGYQFIDGAPTFVATTEVRPISRLAAEEYRTINEFGFLRLRLTILSMYMLMNSKSEQHLRGLYASWD